jgi:hypothetical protein
VGGGQWSPLDESFMFACVYRLPDSPRSFPFPETVIKILYRAKMSQVRFGEKVFDSCLFSGAFQLVLILKCRMVVGIMDN